ncbi:hypothetical protein F2Q69_00038743 [Brassica cretica]|uniref:Myb-like domain-containing protein n=1 Tax=Brassica cretica TaxID=69181 RepID=A0A8S9ST09_BRACR|nr:hypothetical protein F2Q69_00038743 [Brassica cretica]
MRKATVSIASPLSTREELGESLPKAEPASKESVTFPKETTQRWERVAAAVPGKTVVQCKKKFAELKELIRSNKTRV